MKEPRERRPITARQLAVLRLMSQGKTTDEIAARLGVSRNTVRDHIRIIFSKMHTCDRAHAVARALREGLIS